jgi:hypothetical protein
MKIRNLIACLAIIVVGYSGGYFLGIVTAATPYECPAGSYAIGDGVCKNEPTGCPYGDSIPLDSPKCAPPPEPALKETMPEIPPTPVDIAPVMQEPTVTTCGGK